MPYLCSVLPIDFNCSLHQLCLFTLTVNIEESSLCTNWNVSPHLKAAVKDDLILLCLSTLEKASEDHLSF